jgi:hypothetical protein
MRIEGLTDQSDHGRSRIAATIIWEDSPRPPQEVHFEVATGGPRLICTSDAFLTAATLPAFWHGEARLRVDAEVCPELWSGLQTAMGVIRHWYSLGRPPLRLEARGVRLPRSPRIPDRAGFFYTGGIDSLATLRANRLAFPPEHPGYIRDGILVFGLEVEDRAAFQHVIGQLTPLAHEAGIEVLVVETSERYLDPDWNFWIDVFEGAVLAAVAHALAGRLTAVSIAASFDIPNLHRLASHPMLDPFYSSVDVRIRHDGAALSRFEKTRLVAGWEPGLRHLRVCNDTRAYGATRLNCGHCEKCLRTMLALLAVGALDRATAFPPVEITEARIRDVARLHRKNFRFWAELIEPLERAGRHDLARGVRYVLDRYHGELGWRGAGKRFDRLYLNGGLQALRNAFRRGSSEPQPFTGAGGPP